MQYVFRLMIALITRLIDQNNSVLLLGPRQTGKTTLIRNQLSPDFSYSFISPADRMRYQKAPDLLEKEVKRNIDTLGFKKRPLVFIDEVQYVPAVMDVVQSLIDDKVCNFVLTGSSARKLRRGQHINLLPGRVVVLHLAPLIVKELFDPYPEIEHLLYYGTMPGIYTLDSDEDKELKISSYVNTYLEEEIRAEAAVRNVGDFARFLELAAIESGKTLNINNISQELGISYSTIQSYYEILQDCLIAERVNPLTKSMTRKRLVKSPRYLMFDLGVRRLSAEEGVGQNEEMKGHLFEQFIGLELIRCSRLVNRPVKIYFWRSHDGPEVDWVIKDRGKYIPIEVKWTDIPRDRDIRHLHTFLDEYPETQGGYVVCRTPRALMMSERVTAIPWQDVDDLILG